MATHTPGIAEAISDMLSIGEGLDIRQHEIGPEGATAAQRAEWGPIVGVRRGDELLAFDDERAAALRPGDHVITLYAHPAERSGS
jgi:hypothetical protein